MKAMWQLWSDFLSDETCDSIIEHAAALPVHVGTVGHPDFKNGTYAPDTRRSDVRWIYRDNPNFADLWRLVEQYFAWANRNAFGFDSHYTAPLQFTTYRQERLGHYDWHEDVFWETDAVFQRKLSMVVQVSDPSHYEGGDLELDVPRQPSRDELRKRGTIIIYPGFVKHRVTPVTGGLRHSLVAWQEGPLWR